MNADCDVTILDKPTVLLSCVDADGNLTAAARAEIEELTQLASIKGRMGEFLIRRFLESEGFIVYTTKTNASHCFDLLAVKSKQDCFFIECKTKARRERYADTGISLKHYREYRRISDKVDKPLIILFIDESLGEVYGNYITKLTRPYIDHNRNVYPLIRNGIIYFPLANMKRNIARLDQGTVDALSRVSRRAWYPVDDDWPEPAQWICM